MTANPSENKANNGSSTLRQPEAKQPETKRSDTTRLAAQQKRLAFWQKQVRHLNNHLKGGHLRNDQLNSEQITDLVGEINLRLAECSTLLLKWSTEGALATADLDRLLSLERELTELENDVRLLPRVVS